MKFILFSILVLHGRFLFATEISLNPVWPYNWVGYEISHTPVPDNLAEDCLATVNSFLSFYPQSLVSNQLPKVIVLGSMKVDSSSYRGTNQFELKEIYVVCSVDSISMLRTLHHELSSILIWNNMELFNFSDWVDQNPNGLDSYILGWDGDASEAAKLNVSGDYLDESLFSEGFLTPYSQSSFINDFNSFAEFILVLPEELLSLMSYERIENKTKQFIEFYSKLGIPVRLE